MKTLEDEGILFCCGGAARLKKGLIDLGECQKYFACKKKRNYRQMRSSTCERRRSYLSDSGSTPMRMVKHLRDKQITIVTTSATIFQEMEGRSAECIIVGGEINFNTGSIIENSDKQPA